MDEREIEALERELPALARLRRFSAALSRIPWFANLGEPLTPGARATALAYSQGLGFPDAELAILVDWDDAAAAAENIDWNSPAWEAEELMRADLTGAALEFLSEDALQIAMTMIADRVSEPAREAMEQASFIWDVEDDAQKQLAVGAAVQAAHLASLVLVAAADPDFDADDHPFTAKFRLFEFGRWPVGVIGSSFNIF
ncbi:MAG: hypothetical protein R3C42_04825 [Parvularculaceae bacterium]|nr:hypothetical protein [Parvularculaceae bacterium]